MPMTTTIVTMFFGISTAPANYGSVVTAPFVQAGDKIVSVQVLSAGTTSLQPLSDQTNLFGPVAPASNHLLQLAGNSGPVDLSSATFLALLVRA
jgi:hypothetical protein